MSQEIVYIGLGSNLNNPQEQLKKAITELSALPFSQLKKVSSFYESVAIGPSQPNYINACAELETRLNPQELLEHLHLIEQQHGRKREIHWGPRTLDLDILLYGSLIIKTDNLTIPHPEMLNRDFVIIPLLEINPDLRLSKIGLLRNMGEISLKKLESVSVFNLSEVASSRA